MANEAATTIQSSVVDGIALTPRFRERNLAALHRTLESARAEVVAAIRQEGTTSEEALFQFLLTLSAINTFHGTVDPQSCQKVEYQVARSQDYPDQRRAYGYAYIVPAEADAFYSTIVAVTAALSAGNCVLVERHTERSGLSRTVEKLLTSGLSTEVFSYVSEDPFDTDFQYRYRIVLRGSLSPSPGANLKSTSMDGQVIAIVDRGADMRSAARDCVHARFAFGGRSAYAPDIVLVNDFCVKEFTSAVGEAALQYLTGYRVNDKTSRPADSSREASMVLAKALEHGTVLVSGDAGKVVLLGEQDDTLLSLKVDSPALLILPVTSVDDAIDWINRSQLGLAATYIYSTPKFAKYVSQFVQTSLSLINHIPPELLVGPCTPPGFATTIHPRYTPQMFSVASPAFIEQPIKLQDLTLAIWPGNTKQKSKGLEDLIDAKLTPVKEPFGPVVGFFEQGFLLGASLILTTTITCCALSIKYGYPAIVTRLAR